MSRRRGECNRGMPVGMLWRLAAIGTGSQAVSGHELAASGGCRYTEGGANRNAARRSQARDGMVTKRRVTNPNPLLKHTDSLHHHHR